MGLDKSVRIGHGHRVTDRGGAKKSRKLRETRIHATMVKHAFAMVNFPKYADPLFRPMSIRSVHFKDVSLSLARVITIHKDGPCHF